MDALTYASIQVLVDGQAWLYAALALGTDGPDDEFQAAMNEFKQEHANLVEQVIMELVEKAEAIEEEEADDEQE